MSYPRYRIGTRLKKRLFRKSVVVYDIIKGYTYWHDSSHGNGGGSTEVATKKLYTYKSEGEALKIVDQLKKSYINSRNK